MIVASVSNVVVWAVWVVAALACLTSGIAVISFTNPFYSALALIGNLGSLAVVCLRHTPGHLYTYTSPRDRTSSRMPSWA